MKAFVEGIMISLAVIGNLTLFYIVTIDFGIVMALISLTFFTACIFKHFLDIEN